MKLGHARMTQYTKLTHSYTHISNPSRTIIVTLHTCSIVTNHTRSIVTTSLQIQAPSAEALGAIKGILGGQIFNHWFWAVFGGPWAKFGGTQLLQIGSKSSTWTSHSPFHLCSTLFQPFGTTGAFRSPFWPTWALFGPFLGPGGPKFDKFCVGEVERGPGHLESWEKKRHQRCR